jgi:cystathionine beta-lyase/cystathionine gamma-synthase
MAETTRPMKAENMSKNSDLWTNLRAETRLVHQPRCDLPEGNGPLVTPIHQSVKYRPSSMAHVRQILAGRNQGFLYSRIANPTVRELELLLSQLQGCDDAIATGSGVAALTAIMMTFLKAGDRAVVFTESYKPTRFLLKGLLAKFGVDVIRLSRDDYAGFEAVCQSSEPPKIIFLESPTNPVLRLHDLEHLTNTARAAGCLTVLDNTFAGFFAHKEFAIDLYIHSLTKQACGHSDAMGGVIIAKKTLIDQIFPVAITLGACLDPNSAWLILRGLKTLGLRARFASQSSHDLALWLKSQSWAKNIRYPALPDHPDYQLWLKQGHGDGGSVVTFDLDCTPSGFDRFFDNLKLFALAPSLGCVESLAAPCLLFFGDDLSPQEAKQAGITSQTIRLAIGLEHIEDLKSDLRAAAAAALQPI